MVEWPAATVQANGITLNYYRTGGGKPPVVMLHGITDIALCWQRVALALQADYDLVLLDARGHGLSDKPATGYGSADHAADVAGVIDALGLDRPVLLGHSMGAMTASVTAATYPDRVRAVILEDPPWMAAPPDPEEQRLHTTDWEKRHSEQAAMSLETLAALKRQESPTWHDLEIEPWALSRHQTSPHIFQYVEGNHFPWREVAASLRCPGLLVAADVARGAIVTPGVAAEAARLWNGCRVVHLADAGHSIHREQFDTYMAAVSAFLAEIYPV